MNLEFHYYVVHWLALRAGIDPGQAQVMAYSSQYVDKAILGFDVSAPSGSYATIITQDYVFWDEATARNVYLPFHFLPGGRRGPAPQRADGQANPFSVLPDSDIAKEILIVGLKTRDPYRVGIALHAYADTWAHQNFSGLNEDWNTVDPASPWPRTGHAQVLTAPDPVAGVWEDARLKPPYSAIRNRDRFIEAAAKIYKYLCTYNKRSFDDAPLVMEALQRLWGRPGAERPMSERILDYVIDGDMLQWDGQAWTREAGLPADDASERVVGYEKLRWLKRELAGRVGLARRERLSLDDSFFRSRLYAWNQAAVEHRAAAQAVLKREGLLP